jgi:outer membrane protein assembly factor BamB
MNRKNRYKRKRHLRILITCGIGLVTIAALSFVFFITTPSMPSETDMAEKHKHFEYDKPTAEKQENDIDTNTNTSIVGEKTEDENSVTAEEVEMPQVLPSCLPENFTGFSWEVIKDGQVLEDFKRNCEITFPNFEEYSTIQGVTCFRGNNYRNSASYGFANVREEKLEKVWFFETGYIDIWTGVGWTGQPAIIKWDEGLRKKMNLFPVKKQKNDLKEVIYATLDGKIYFLDLDDGTPTRNAIDIGYPHKGSVAVDPRGYPLLYAGQGIPEKGGKQGPIGYRIINLINQKIMHFIDGYDKDAFRRWGAFDSGGLIDSKTDTLIECGENGILYTVNLNTKYSPEEGSISIAPEEIKYRYRSPISTKIGVENSPVIYKNYIYFADNSGLLQCIDLNILKPVWLRNVTDDTDSTMVLEEVSSSEVFLYTGCEVDIQGENGFSYIRKINALTGELVWEKAVKCYYDSNTNGGAMASPVIGKYDIENLIIFNIAKTENSENNKNKGKLLALDKKTGKDIWTIDLDYYCWSSPVDIYTKDGKSYLLVCDSGGYMRLLEGTSGKELDRIPLEANIEASPAVYENMIVAGTRGQKIWGIRIK